MPSSPQPPDDLAEARATLGVAPDAPWAAVRDAYRVAIRAAHPDLAGGSTHRAVAVNAAYATLASARRAGLLQPRTPTRRSSPPAGPPPAAGRGAAPTAVGHGVLAAGDTLILPLPPDEAFAVVLEACHRVGDVTYVDRQCAIVEALLRVAGEGTCSLVITFQGRAHGTEAFCTLEAIEHVGSPPIAGIVGELGEVAAEVLDQWRAPSEHRSGHTGPHERA